VTTPAGLDYGASLMIVTAASRGCVTSTFPSCRRDRSGLPYSAMDRSTIEIHAVFASYDHVKCKLHIDASAGSERCRQVYGDTRVQVPLDIQSLGGGRLALPPGHKLSRCDRIAASFVYVTAVQFRSTPSARIADKEMER
jgi:hypothetical protein